MKEAINMLFSDFMDTNKIELKSNMIWDNYELNDVVLTVDEDLKEKAWLLLKQNYGKYEVENILDEMNADISINFPLLMQSLSIASSMTYQSVSRTDHEVETRTVTETGLNTHSNTQVDSSQRDVTNSDDLDATNGITGTVANTGTITTAETSERSETNILDGSNTSTTPMTGSKNVALNHSMPEQDINEVTGDFDRDSQGTPELDVSTVQSASENYSTINQFQNTQDIDQTQTVSNSIENNNTVTNDTLVTTNNTTTEHSERDVTERDILAANSTTNGTDEVEHETTENVERDLANKQYPYEISRFLESIAAVKSFQKWVDSFYWICGVV
jgi:hypothetical protein